MYLFGITFQIVLIFRTILVQTVGNSHMDLVQPNETHLEGVPIFIQHPKPLYYTMKDHPATIECIAEPVSHAVIECAEQVIPYKGPDESGRLKVVRLDSNNQLDPNGDRWHLKLQVRAKEVEEWFDSYVCRCEAWNKIIQLQRPKKVISKSAVVVEAYLERRFKLEPISTQLLVGQRLELSCIAPEGKPQPEVYWMKDGVRLGYPRLVYRSPIDGRIQLAVDNLTQKDSGNYTCVAELLGTEFRFATAQVRVIARKTLVTKSPVLVEKEIPPVHQILLSRDWFIVATMFLTLAAVLIIIATLIVITRKHKRPSANWLFQNCFKTKRQKSNGMVIKNPSVYNVLIPEHTSNSALVQLHREKLGDLSWIPPVPSVAPYETLDGTLGRNRQVPLQILPPEARYPPFRSHGQAFPNGGFMNPMSSIPGTTYVPGLCQPVYTLANQMAGTQMETGLPMLNTNGKPLVPIETTISLTHSPPPLPAQTTDQSNIWTKPVKSSPEGPCSLDSTTNTTHISSSREDSGSNSDNHVTGGNGLLQSSVIQLQNREMTMCCSSVKGMVDRTGGQLHLPAADVNMTIPPGSLAKHGATEVYVNVCSGDQCRPVVPDHQTLLTSVIEIGPANLQFDHPVLLTFPHCADLDRGNWRIYLLGARHNQFSEGTASGTCHFHQARDSTDDLHWEILGVIGRETGNSNCKCQINGPIAQLWTTVAQCYCLVGESNNNNREARDEHDYSCLMEMSSGQLGAEYLPMLPDQACRAGVKLLSLMAFARPVPVNVDCIIRVYVVPDTNHFLNQAIGTEKAVGFELMDMVRHWAFVDNGVGLTFQLRNLADGWKSRSTTEKLEIPFRHIWSGSHTSMIHCSFSLRNTTAVPSSVSCLIGARQGENVVEEAILRVANSTVQ